MARKYPDFHFVVSQPQQLVWVREQDPDLYRELKRLEKDGIMEIIGGGWVESDTNLPGEESLARQMLYGQKFWKEEFGHYVKTCWLPDAFGYSAGFPQILKLSGQDSFMTIKISWSNRTVFPYNSFYWEGVDGTRILAHMPPEGNYNSLAGPKALLNAKNGIKQSDPKDRLMMVYGVGDGGGGPSETTLERNRRTSNVPYLPKVKMGSAQAYFDQLRENVVIQRRCSIGHSHCHLPPELLDAGRNISSIRGVMTRVLHCYLQGNIVVLRTVWRICDTPYRKLKTFDCLKSAQRL